MSTNLLAFKLLFSPVVAWAACRTLVGRNRASYKPEKGRFTQAEVALLLDQSWHDFDEIGPDVSVLPTFGSRMNVRLAALTLSMLRNLANHGIERRYAIELIGDTCWKVYRYWGHVGRFLGRLTRRHPIKDRDPRRITPAGDWVMSFPFNPPGYHARYVDTEGGLGFNVIRCPVAEYFHKNGSEDLAVNTWCMLDYPLAEMIGLRLVRTRTLASCDPYCDFRWFSAVEEN